SDVPGPAHRVGLLLVAAGRFEREALGNEIVAAVAVGDVDDVALLAHVGEVGTEDDLHSSSPSSSTSSTSTSPAPSPAPSSRMPANSVSTSSSSPSPSRDGGGPCGRGGGPSARPGPPGPRSRDVRCVVTRLV